MKKANYPIVFIIAPIMIYANWKNEYLPIYQLITYDHLLRFFRFLFKYSLASASVYPSFIINTIQTVFTYLIMTLL
ncbi:hypothetical protein [Oceanirhabdus sp. W0125-5]|uniref:hypothetical protein n=1 Tax=Oceanirhabdus sp. W0125-5 TaxID=2999116 RepID=UPI003FA56023